MPMYLSLQHQKTKNKRIAFDSFCEVLKLAAKPSCLGGGDSETKSA